MTGKLALNVVCLYPEWHCNRCEATVCDLCGAVGYECLADREEVVATLGAQGASTVVQAFVCHACKTDPEAQERLKTLLLEVSPPIKDGDQTT